jgi:hypothetical protein
MLCLEDGRYIFRFELPAPNSFDNDALMQDTSDSIAASLPRIF